MDIEITVALITLAGSASGSMAGILVANKLTNYRIEQLEKKVEKHNTIVERMYNLEECAALHEEKIKVANRRIADLEESEKSK